MWPKTRKASTAATVEAFEIVTSYQTGHRHEFTTTARNSISQGDQSAVSTKTIWLLYTNDAILQLAAFAYNGLRLVGQLGLTGDIAPIRHPAKRRRIRTVLQEIMYRAAKFVAHARQLVLDFGRGVAAHAKVFLHVQERLWAATG